MPITFLKPPKSDLCCDLTTDGGLKALLGRIKTQREGWVRKTNTESPAPTLTQYTVTSGSSEAGTLETGISYINIRI